MIKSVHDPMCRFGLTGLAGRMHYTPSGATLARGHKELKVGDLVSSYTKTTSSAATAEGGFCEDFRASVSAAVTQLNLEDQDFMAIAPSSDPPTEREVLRWGRL